MVLPFALRNALHIRRCISIVTLTSVLCKNRTTFMERLSERLAVMNRSSKKLEPVENLLSVWLCWRTPSTRPRKFLPFRKRACISAFPRACCTNLSIGQRRSRITSHAARCFTAKEELDEWLPQNCEPSVDEAMRIAKRGVSNPTVFFNQKRYGKTRKRTERITERNLTKAGCRIFSRYHR